ncbi:hypothetical protein [Methylobacterium sp. Leaf399]|uniref:hypothetical protein n=1 Tax=Methylobacterium sp. Leaf399 TaxID=1736364 RepID=UPI000B2CEAB7|nr:hypothetical protein [Methylobacterium sp. Leaf399]
MLNDYGIQHFHLGTRPDPRRPHLIEGTKELLFAIVKDRDFYAIGIYDHDDWTKRALLDVVHATWPELTEPYTLKDSPHMKVLGLRHNYTDDEVKKLRGSGVNALQQRPDGKVQIGMGGGVASDSTSLAVRRETDVLIVQVEELQKTVVEALSQHVTAGHLPADSSVRVVWDADTIYAVPNPAVFKVNITGRLKIPPL